MNMAKQQDTALDVGARLRLLRESHGLSQRELAKRSGVTNGFISQLEAAKINPSIGALKRVLDGFPIGLAQFFALQREREDKVFFAAEELHEIGKGGISYRQVGSSLLGNELQMLHEVYEPNADTGRVLLSHDGEEVGIVVEGRLEVTVGDQRKVLGPGDAYLFRSKVPHRFRVVGNGRCVAISACTPPTF